MAKRLLPVLVAALLVAGGVILVNGRGSEDGHASKPANVAVKGRPHVVMLVMDEFPPDALLGADGRVDASRYPNFAALARSSTWFPNATTVYDSTTKAIPAILDGVMPQAGKGAEGRDHPNSIYSLLGKRGYRVVNSEEATAICPRRYCSNARSKRPGILGNLNRGRQERFRRWLGTIRPSRRPTLWLKHALLPHGPWMFLPSGKQTRPSVKDPVPGLASPAGFHDPGLTDHNHARYRLQLGYADREVGRLLQQLRRTGLYDKTLLAVVADHGYAWEIGVADRRKVTRSNVDEIAPVPLFIKAPGQRRGRREGAYARTIDVVPTIADVLNVRLGYRASGSSAFSRASRRRRYVRLPTRDFKRVVKISARSIERRRRANRRRYTRLFGTGVGSAVAFGDPWASVYRVGPRRDVLGRTLDGIPVGRQGRIRASLANARLTQSVRTSSNLIPAQLGGRITGARRGAKRDIAVAVNGRIEATARSFYLKTGGGESFAAIVPERSLREGRNAIRIFQVTGRGGSTRLTPLGSN